MKPELCLEDLIGNLEEFIFISKFLLLPDNVKKKRKKLKKTLMTIKESKNCESILDDYEGKLDND